MRTTKLVLAAVLVAILGLGLGVDAALAGKGALDSKEWKRAEKMLKAGLAAGDMDVASGAIVTIGTDDSKRAVKMLLAIGLKLDNSKIFEATKEALGSMRSEEAVGEMLKGLEKNKDWRVRVLLVETLADVPGDATTDAIANAVAEDKVAYVITAAAKALAKRGDAQRSVEGLIAALEKTDGNRDVAWKAVREALTELTGYDFETPSDWKNFWEPRKAEWTEESRGDKSEVGGTMERDAPKFFSEEIVSKRILFIIDVSGSMAAEDPPAGDKQGGKRIERAKAELVKVVSALNPKYKFNIIAYSDGVRSWQKARIVPATPANRQSAIKWVQGMQPAGFTRTDKALEEGFKNNEINTIFLLSDGAPQKDMNPYTPAEIEGIVEQVRNANKFRHVRVETFGFDAVAASPGGNVFVDFLKKLADENDGEYHGI